MPAKTEMNTCNVKNNLLKYFINFLRKNFKKNAKMLDFFGGGGVV